MPTGDGSAARLGSIAGAGLAIRVVAELDMTNLMGHKKGLLDTEPTRS